ncbi:PHA/PHB synthase family protein [Zhongshania sp.]|uniref:PHA/PHB synthase family protein n=1 Tax=Zhongshania sp. TaxID=1971902 RepID=UPI003564AB53
MNNKHKLDVSQADSDPTKAAAQNLAGLISHYLNFTMLRQQGLQLAKEEFKILKGESELQFGRDPRFSDESWHNNKVFNRLGQSYLAFCQAVDGLLENETGNWLDQERVKFTAELVKATLSPSNLILSNPAALKHAKNTRGKSLVRGLRNFFDDLKNNGGVPSSVDRSAYEVGGNLALSKGAVIYRNEHLEVIQYQAQTPQVYRIPVLMMTPQINRYYFLDLAPGRSMVEYMLSQGYQVFMVSWRNPTAKDSAWNLGNYCHALSGAIDAVAQICGVKKINTFGFCAGGITMSALLSYMQSKNKAHKINAISYAVTLLDFSKPAMIGIFRADTLLSAAKMLSRKKGVLDGKVLSNMFSLLRPNDLVFNYWVNNYLMGNPPPNFDILAWNADSTDLPAGLHDDFLSILESNALVRGGAFSVLDTPLDMATVTQDAFVLGAVNDHLTPWTGCYQTTQLLGGNCEFVLSSAGHIAALVNPPSNPKSQYWTGPTPGPDADAWRAAAHPNTGSWWEAWAQWASSRSGDKRRAKTSLGSKKYPALEAAPGKYVFE